MEAPNRRNLARLRRTLGYDSPMASSATQLSSTLAVDRHADTRTAAWAVGEQLAADGGGDASLVVRIGSYHHAAALPEAARTVREAVGSPPLVAITSAGVLAGPDEMLIGPALAAL